MLVPLGVIDETISPSPNKKCINAFGGNKSLHLVVNILRAQKMKNDQRLPSRREQKRVSCDALPPKTRAVGRRIEWPIYCSEHVEQAIRQSSVYIYIRPTRFNKLTERERRLHCTLDHIVSHSALVDLSAPTTQGEREKTLFSSRSEQVSFHRHFFRFRGNVYIALDTNCCSSGGFAELQLFVMCGRRQE